MHGFVKALLACPQEYETICGYMILHEEKCNNPRLKHLVIVVYRMLAKKVQENPQVINRNALEDVADKLVDSCDAFHHVLGRSLKLAIIRRSNSLRS
jgi:hypothetical protein